MSSWLKSAKDNGILRQEYNCISSPGSNRSCGVAILYRTKFELSTCSRDTQGRIVSARFASGTLDFQLCNVYGPNKAKEGGPFFESLYAILQPELPMVVCGDYNTVVDPIKDRRGCNPFSVWAYNWSNTLSQLMSTYDLQDAWRAKHPDAMEFTWQRPNNSQASRLDMFWVSTFFLQLIISVGIFPFSGAVVQKSDNFNHW
jgi:exonuclease III